MENIIRFINRPKFKYYQTIVFVSVLSILVSSLVIYFAIRQTLVKNLINDSVDKLITVMDEQDAILSQADATITEIASNSDIMNYTQNKVSGQNLKSYYSMKDLENYEIKNKYIDRIVVYYLKDKKVLATNWGASEIEDYLLFDPRAYTEQTGTRTLILQTGAARNKEEPGSVSLIRYAPISYAINPKVIISINVGGEFFKSFHNIERLWRELFYDGQIK